MRRTPTWSAAMAVAGLVLGAAAPALAAPDPDFTLLFGDSEACPGINLRSRAGTASSSTASSRIQRQRGADHRVGHLRYTNTLSGASYETKSNGAVSRITFNADGTSTVTATGHNLIILFPSDVPAGPSTTLYVGQVRYTVDAAGVFTLQKTSGRSVDICAMVD